MNIFVAKLDYSTEEHTLQTLFEGYGEVTSAKIIMDRETGRSKGFGFVEMSNDEEAREAIGGLDGALVDGRNIVVKEAEDRRNNNRGGYNNNRGGGYGGGRNNYGNNRGGYGNNNNYGGGRY